MPIPSPKGPEEKNKFISRCMSDKVMKKEFPDNKQRVAVCLSKYKKAKAKQGFELDFAEQTISYTGLEDCGC